MRLWIAAFLISLFAFQALPVTALGKSLQKAKISAGEHRDEDGDDDGGDVPEPGKLKKSGPSIEDHYLPPPQQRTAIPGALVCRSSFPPEQRIAAAAGHAELDTPPPDRG